MYEASFPPRVAAFLRYSPVIEAAQAARRRDWADGAYDIVTLALTAIDLVVSRQGFEEEATRADVVSALTGLAALAAPDRTAEEHANVARFVIDFLLNRQAHHAKFQYLTSDYSSAERRHQRREVPFSLLEGRDDAARDENVLRATADAINALIGRAVRCQSAGSSSKAAQCVVLSECFGEETERGDMPWADDAEVLAVHRRDLREV